MASERTDRFGRAYGAFALCYDRLMEHMPYDRWLEWVKCSWERYGKPHTVVDLGCGTGTLTIALAEAGLKVYGLDNSPDMLAVAEAKVKERADAGRGEMVFLEQDMRDWTLTESVDAVYSFCDSLNYLPGLSDLGSTFASVFRALRPNGLFLFDMLSENQYEWYGKEQPFVLDEDDVAYIWHCDYDKDEGLIEHDLTIFFSEDGGKTFRRFDECHVQRAYAPSIVVRELERAGFVDVRCGSDFSWNEPNEQSERLFFAAVKP